MYDTMRTKYYWTQMTNDVYKTVRDCKLCARNRQERKQQQILRLLPVLESLEFIAINIPGPLSRKSDNQYIIVEKDLF